MDELSQLSEIVKAEKPIKKLKTRFTVQEQLFIDYYVINPGVTVLEAVKQCFPDLKSHKSKANSLESRLDIVLEIERREQLNRYNVEYTPQDVIEALWREAVANGIGSSHTARVTALNILGKHIGLFKPVSEKTGKEKSIVYNIVNYQTTPDPDIEKLETIPAETVKEIVEEQIPENITVKKY